MDADKNEELNRHTKNRDTLPPARVKGMGWGLASIGG
jgi:hypothetical protein